MTSSPNHALVTSCEDLPIKDIHGDVTVAKYIILPQMNYMTLGGS